MVIIFEHHYRTKKSGPKTGLIKLIKRVASSHPVAVFALAASVEHTAWILGRANGCRGGKNLLERRPKTASAVSLLLLLPLHAQWGRLTRWGLQRGDALRGGHRACRGRSRPGILDLSSLIRGGRRRLTVLLLGLRLSLLAWGHLRILKSLLLALALRDCSRLVA